MKRMILSPKRDTVTICIPPEWVGQSVVCILKESEKDPAIPTLLELHDVECSYNANVRSRIRHPHRIRRLRKHP